MKRRLPFLSLLLACALALTACATPSLLGAGGGAASAQDTEGKTATLEPQVGLVQPGAFGGVTQSKLAYQRQSTGTQSAPSVILNLQPGPGAAVAGSYPELRVVVLSPIIVMGNSQVEPTLSSEQIDKLKGVVTEAGAAVKGAIDAAAGTSAKPLPAPAADPK